MIDPLLARELVTKCVAIPSISGQEQEVSRFLYSWMSQNGFNAHIDEAGNAIGERGNGSLSIVLLGHIDTVAGDIPVLVDEKDILHGRGSVDAKGSLCAFISAVAGLPQAALNSARFIVVGATEEEAPSSKGARHAIQKYNPDYVFIGEPSGWQGITLGYKGRLVVKISTQKDNFHTAGSGSSAADDVAEACSAIKNWAAGVGVDGGIFDKLQATIQDINSSGDGMQQHASAVVGLRLPPSMSHTEAESEIKSVLSGIQLDISFAGQESAIKHPKDNKLTRAIRTAIRAEGGTPVFKLKTGTSDMNVVAEAWPVPTIAYGPGDSTLDHTPQEHLELSEYDKTVRILHSALISIVSN